MPSPNVVPNWWAYSFMGLQLAALLPLTYAHLFQTYETFADVLPRGVDPQTDDLHSSLRLEIIYANSAQSFLMILVLFLGCVIFARNSLKGQPILQQRLVKLPVYIGLLSDAWLYGVLLVKLPRSVLHHPMIWTPAIKGIVYGLPLATLLKLLWIFGIGRDVV